jgi:endonuclease G
MSDAKIDRRTMLTAAGVTLGGVLAADAGQPPAPPNPPPGPSATLPNTYVHLDEKLKEELLKKLRSGKCRLPRSASRLKVEDVTRFVERGARREAPRTESAADLRPESAPFSPESIIVRDLTRPVLFVQNGTFQTSGLQLAELQGVLEGHRGALQKVIPAVGRINLANHPGFSWNGTGWLVAKDIVVTNRHVANDFAARDGDGFRFITGIGGKQINAHLDLLEEYLPLPTERPYRVLKVLHIDDQFDLALLRIAGATELGEPQPDPVPLFAGAIEPDRWVAAIGYPAYDSRIPEPELMDRIYGKVYDVKRLAPGRVTSATAAEVQHDCSTLGGNSGSAVVDLATGSALALHYGGSFLLANYAVPAPVIADRLAKFKS